MKRKTFVDIAGIDLELLKTLQRRHQVPADASPLPKALRNADAIAEREDTQYGAYDALMLAFANNLVEANSFTRDTAASLFSGIRSGLPQAIRRAESGEDIWWCAGSWNFGCQTEKDIEGNTDSGLRATWDFTEYGTFAEIHMALCDEMARTKEAGGSVTNVSMFCMTPLVLAALDRAKAYGIDSFVG